MLAQQLTKASGPWLSSTGLINKTQQRLLNLKTMCTATQIAVAFQSEAVQRDFERTFRLNENSDVNITVTGQQQAATPTSKEDSSTTTTTTTSSSRFDAATFFQHLRSAQMGHILMTTPSIPSTQEFMRAHSVVLPEGAVLVADQQTKGKGRGGNVWTSPAGCLMFTALRRLKVPGAQAPFINYVVCLAVVQGIKEATKHLIRGGLDVQIKWPNDIYYKGVKIGGALIHTTWSSDQFCVLTGIGLNVSNSQPTTCLNDIITGGLQQQQQPAATADVHEVCKEQLLASVLYHLETCFNTFQAQGFGPLKPMYLSSWMHSNQQVELAEDAAAAAAAGSAGPGGSAMQQRVTLTIVGLSPYGFLLAVDAAGQEYELTPDGNSLDMMQGLIKKKLS